MATTTFKPGDIAIVGYVSNGNPDLFSFVNLVSIPAGTIIYFTNNGWTGTGFNGVTSTNAVGGENLIRFTADSDIALVQLFAIQILLPISLGLTQAQLAQAVIMETFP